MENNLEGNFIGAIGQFVNFDKHRKDYTQHFDALRDQLYSHWRSNKALNKLANGFTLGGSYGDNVKVAMPNEFDLVIHLTFPENDKIMVKADPRRPGNVTLDMTRVMEIICNQEPNKPVFEQLQKMVNGKQMLLEDKLQSWLQGVMTQAVAKMGSQIEVGGVVSPIRYRRCGPAHTIEVKGRCEYSVDFVPAIRLSAAQNVLPAAQKTYFGRTPHWDAIPKPMKPAQPENISFRASYYEAEKQLLHDKKNLKNALRLLKQNRDTKNNVSNLKSYYIKTLFLWEVTRQNASYWQKPVSQIVIDMLDRISNSLNLTSGKGKLLFFWDPRLDMFAELKDNQRTNMFNCVCKTRYTFQRGFGNLTDDIRNNVQSSFDKRAERGSENKPLNEQNNKINPNPNQGCAKKTVQNQTETVKPTPNKKKEAKAVILPVQENAMPNPLDNAKKAQPSQNGKPNRKPIGENGPPPKGTPTAKPNPNEQKGAKVVMPPSKPQPKLNPNQPAPSGQGKQESSCILF